ncbi:hypothetical protein AHOG_16875 [Actinoalloteichus hoggarensis]|uniref:Uncharacterized protein n=1 Tax=Actinoalloteichus hoggarensis TaxID=1470176 RepID=A0A221W5M6_9PSEU|nr:hypothetical protein AHOG_16875 [Actinoalloteichus hoggarensis]
MGAWGLLTGPSADPVRSAVVAGCALGGGVGALLLAPPNWTSWQLLPAVLLAVDLVGGLAAGALPPSRRTTASERTAPARLLVVGAHVLHPALAVLLFGARWEWGLLLFLAMACTVLVLPRVPADLVAVVGLVATTVALTVSVAFFGGPPAGLAWLAPAYLVKLVVSAILGQTATSRTWTAAEPDSKPVSSARASS